MADERSRKRLWEDFVYGFIQKTPADVVQSHGRDAIFNIACLADAMLEEYDKRFPKAKPGTITLTKSEK